MKDVVLYLDKLSPEIEKLLLDFCGDEVDIRFLEPNIGKKGELKDATVFFDTIYKVTKDVVDAAPNLRFIQRTGVGVDMIDMDYVKSKNIPVSIARGCNSISVAELAVANMLALYRHIPQLDKLTKKGRWEDWLFRHSSFEINGKKVGVIGAGAIGREVMKRVKAFNADILYYDVQPLNEEMEKELGAKFTDLDVLIRESDIITIHIPLFPSTRGMFGEKQFEEMKDTAVLINTARGPIVDQKALYHALKEHKIAGAASDVYAGLPADPDDPLFTLGEDVNFIALPHVGAATYDTYYRVFELCMENLKLIGEGKEANYLV